MNSKALKHVMSVEELLNMNELFQCLI